MRDVPPGPPTPGPPRSGPPGGGLQPTSPAALSGWAVVGLVGGWLLHRVNDAVRDTTIVVTWAQPVVLLVVGAILWGIAWLTWRSVQVHRERLQPHQAVNRLVLARACAYAGALVGGGYAGYALSWLNSADALAHGLILRSLVAAVAGAVIAGAGLGLERACRVRKDVDEP